MTTTAVSSARGVTTAVPIDETPARPAEGSTTRTPIDMTRDAVDAGAPRRARAGGTEAITPAAAHDHPSSIRGAARAWADGGSAGLDRWMDAHPDEVRDLLSMRRHDLTQSMRTVLGQEIGGHLGGVRGFVEGGDVVGRIAERAQPMLREAIRREATARMDQRIDALERTTPQALVQAVREAAPGSAMARMGELAGVRGDAMDVERVDQYRYRALEELRELRGVLQGSTWAGDELPGSTRRVAERMGLTAAARESIAGEILARPDREAADVAAYGEMTADVAMTIAEVPHLVHAFGAVAGGTVAGVAVGALVFGIALHHAIDENREERRQIAVDHGL